MRSLLILALVGCGDVERLSLASQCEPDARDAMTVTIDGHALCGRARLVVWRERPSGTHESIRPGSFAVTVAAALMANDGSTYDLSVGLGQRTDLAGDVRGWIEPRPPLRSDKTEIYDGAFAALHRTPALRLSGLPGEWPSTKGGSVELTYDLVAATSRGRFDVVFESRVDDATRIIHATGSFVTTAPIVDDEELVR